MFKKNILSIDTSTQAASIALQTLDGEIFAKFHDAANGPRHSEIILPMINEVLAEAKIEKTQITGIIVSHGPGAFTGLRVGASCANALAYGLNIPLAGFSSLALLAAKKTGNILSILDARMNQFYCAIYKIENHKISTVLEDCLINQDKLKEISQNKEIDVVITNIEDELPIDGQLEVFANEIPMAADIFKIDCNFLNWQKAHNCFKLNYLRNDIVQKNNQN